MFSSLSKSIISISLPLIAIIFSLENCVITLLIFSLDWQIISESSFLFNLNTGLLYMFSDRKSKLLAILPYKFCCNKEVQILHCSNSFLLKCLIIWRAKTLFFEIRFSYMSLSVTQIIDFVIVSAEQKNVGFDNVEAKLI